MFEGKPPLCAQSGARLSAADEADAELRVLSWSELMAKLIAARDLRGIFSQADDELPASFDAISALHLAATHEDRGKKGHLAVNRCDLGNRKGDTGIDCGQALPQIPTTRGNT